MDEQEITVTGFGWDKCPEDNFRKYFNKCEMFSQNDELFNNFKRDPDYQKILEGGEQVVGEMAINNIKGKNKFATLLFNLPAFKENDIYGNPILREYPSLGEIGPSTLRYVNTLFDVQALVGDFKPKRIVEVGGGYGGLCKVMSVLYDFDEYILVDLPPVVKLCEKYISKFENLKGKVKFIASTELEEIKDIDLFISDSAFAECGLEYQNKYIDNLIVNAKYSLTTFNTTHLVQTNDEIQNFINKLTNNNLSSFNFDDKIAFTTRL